MPVELQLLHAEAGRVVVLATAIDGQRSVAMALGEGATAEQAEDRARSRLASQLQTPPPQAQPRPQPTAQPQTQTPAQAQTKSTAQEVSAGTGQAAAAHGPAAVDAEPEPAPDPDDWSAELASLELQLRRLGWEREQEAIYLLRAFGHGSRAQLTRYGDLMAYLRALETLSPGTDPASCAVPLRRSDLLQQCDALLQQLGWDAARGRRLLETEFNCSSRQQLSDTQLLNFNMLLESELLAAPAAEVPLNSAVSAG